MRYEETASVVWRGHAYFWSGGTCVLQYDLVSGTSCCRACMHATCCSSVCVVHSPEVLIGASYGHGGFVLGVHTVLWPW